MCEGTAGFAFHPPAGGLHLVGNRVTLKQNSGKVRFVLQIPHFNNNSEERITVG